MKQIKNLSVMICIGLAVRPITSSSKKIKEIVQEIKDGR